MGGFIGNIIDDILLQFTNALFAAVIFILLGNTTDFKFVHKLNTLVSE